MPPEPKKRLTLDLSPAERQLLYDWADMFNGVAATEIMRAMLRYFAAKPAALKDLGTILQTMSRERREAKGSL